MGNTESNVTSGVKKQADTSSILMYKLVDLNGGGLLVELTKQAAQTKQYAELDHAIKTKVEPFLYNKGEGAVIPVWKLVLMRNKERPRHKLLPILKSMDDPNEFDIDTEILTPPEVPEKLGPNDHRKVCWDLNERGAVGETILHLCLLNATSIHADLAKRLLKFYPRLIDDIYTSDEYYGENVLHIAIVNEDPTMVKFLLDNGANYNDRCLGSFFGCEDQKASKNDSLEHEWFTLQLETNYEGYVYWGEYPLSIAACLGLEECYRLLLARGANPDNQDTNGNTVLHMLIIHEKMQSFDMAYEAGADLEIQNALSLTPLTLAAKLARVEMFFHILNIEREIYWQIGNITCAAYPLSRIDTIDNVTGYINNNSALNLVVFGDKDEHLELMDGVIIDLLNAKWNTFVKFRFYRQFLQFSLYFLISVVCFTLRPGPAQIEPPNSVTYVTDQYSSTTDADFQYYGFNKSSVARRSIHPDHVTLDANYTDDCLDADCDDRSSNFENGSIGDSSVRSVITSELTFVPDSNVRVKRSPVTASGSNNGENVTTNTTDRNTNLSRRNSNVVLDTQTASVTANTFRSLPPNPSSYLNTIDSPLSTSNPTSTNIITTIANNDVITNSNNTKTVGGTPFTIPYLNSPYNLNSKPYDEGNKKASEFSRSISSEPPIDNDDTTTEMTSVEENELEVSNEIGRDKKWWKNIIGKCRLLIIESYKDIVRMAAEIILEIGAFLYLLAAIREAGFLGVNTFIENLMTAPSRVMFLFSCLLMMILPFLRFSCLDQIEDIIAVVIMLTTSPYFLFYCRGFKTVGPFVVMIYRMVMGDLLRFVMIYLVFVMGFSQAYYIIFLTFDNPATPDGVDDSITNPMPHPMESFMAMFLMSLTTFSDYYGAYDKTNHGNIAKFCFVLYMVIVAILLVNMLIAMMGNTYQKIAETRNEWQRQWARIVLVVERSVNPQDRLKKLMIYSQPMSDGRRALVLRLNQTDEDKEEMKDILDMKRSHQRNKERRKMRNQNSLQSISNIKSSGID